MITMKYLKSLGIVCLYFLMNFALLKTVAFLFYHTPLYHIPGFKLVIDQNPHIPYLVWFLLGIAVMAVLVKMLKKKSIIAYCNFSAVKVKDFWTIIYIGIGGFIFNTAFINIAYIDQHFPQFDTFLKSNYEASYILFGILAAVVAGPIYEEILFRGLILNELTESLPFTAAALIQSVLYGVLFFDIPLAMFCFVAALMYSFVYRQLGTLWSVIIVEFVETLAVLVSRRMGIESVISNIGDIYMIPAFLLSIVIIISGCYILWRRKHSDTSSNLAA